MVTSMHLAACAHLPLPPASRKRLPLVHGAGAEYACRGASERHAVRASVCGSGEQSRVAAARASCQTMRTSECGSQVAFAEPRKGRVKREFESKESDEPGVEGQCPRGLGLLKGPAELEQGRARNQEHSQRLDTERHRLEGAERISGQGVFQKTSPAPGSVSCVGTIALC